MRSRDQGVAPAGPGHSPKGGAAISGASPAKPSVPNAVVEKLVEARKLIERPGGWCQGLYAFNGGVCSMGALNTVFGGNPEIDTQTVEWRAAMDCLERAAVCPWVDVWNDSPERTQADVLAAFDKAIELARETTNA